MDPDDVKWKSVETTSREILYFTNKITGQQKWTNKNCYCSKPKDPLQTTLPCCYKVSSLTPKSTEKDLTNHSYARRQHKALFSKKLYCLSDIVNEVQKSLLAKGHRKHKRREHDVPLDFKKKLIVHEDSKNDLTITKNPLSDETSEKPRDDVIDVVGFQDHASISNDTNEDVKTVSDSSNESKIAKNDVSVKDDSSSDVNVSYHPPPLSKEPKDKVLITDVTQNDVTAGNDVGNAIIIVKDVNGFADRKNDVKQAQGPEFITDTTTVNEENDASKATEDMEVDVTSIIDLNDDVTLVKDLNSEPKDSSDVLSNEPGITNDVTATENMEVDVTFINDLNDDVTVVKDLNIEGKDSKHILNEPSKTKDVTAAKDRKDVVTRDKENDNSDAKDANDVPNEPRKLNEKVMPNRGLKRKREVNDVNVNGYKGRLRVRQNKIQQSLRRKYRRRKPLKSAAVSNNSSQPDSVVTSKLNPSKKQRLDADNEVLLTNCDLIEQSIIEINRFTSGYFANNKPTPDLESQCPRSGGAEPGMSNMIPEKMENTNPGPKPTAKKKPNGKTETPIVTGEPRFIDEQFLQMNIPFQSLTKVDNKKSKPLKTIDGAQKKQPVSEKKRQKELPGVSYTNRSDITKLISSSQVARGMSKKVLTVNLASYRPLATKVGTSASSSCTTMPSVKLQTKSQVNNKEKSTEKDVKPIDNGKLNSEKIKVLSSSELVNNSAFSSWGKFGSPPKRSGRHKSLDTIVNNMNSPNKAEVLLTSTTSMTSWLTTLSNYSKKIKKCNTETNEDTLRGSEGFLNTEQIGGVSCPNDVGTDFLESDSSVMGHVEETFSLGSMPQIPSKEAAVQGSSQSTSGLINSKKPDCRKGVAGRKPKNTCEAGTNTLERDLLFPAPEQDRDVTEVPASHVDLSWRIVTSNDGHSSSLKNFFKLVPVTIARGPSGTVDAQEPRSFLGVPMHGGPAVIAKILNTSVAQNCNEVFTLSRKPGIVTAGTYVKKSTLSFVWDSDSVFVNSESPNAGSLSGKDVKPRPPVWIDICNRVSIILPKTLRLPEAGNVVYLGDFNVKADHVEFVVTHSVVVTTSPRPSLTVPSGTPVSSSNVSQAIKCRSPGKAKRDAQAARKASVVNKGATKGGYKMFEKCVFCGSALMCRRDVKFHRKLHGSCEGTKCSECKRRFHNGSRLSVHLDTHKCNWLHVCAKCNRPYRTPKFLAEEDLAKDYYKMCLPCRRRQLKCKKCTEMLFTFNDLKLHLKEKHGLQCPICNSSFLFKRDLSTHMSTEHAITSVPSSDTAKS